MESRQEVNVKPLIGPFLAVYILIVIPILSLALDFGCAMPGCRWWLFKVWSLLVKLILARLSRDDIIQYFRQRSLLRSTIPQ